MLHLHLRGESYVGTYVNSKWFSPLVLRSFELFYLYFALLVISQQHVVCLRKLADMCVCTYMQVLEAWLETWPYPADFLVNSSHADYNKDRKRRRLDEQNNLFVCMPAEARWECMYVSQSVMNSKCKHGFMYACVWFAWIFLFFCLCMEVAYVVSGWQCMGSKLACWWVAWVSGFKKKKCCAWKTVIFMSPSNCLSSFNGFLLLWMS